MESSAAHSSSAEPWPAQAASCGAFTSVWSTIMSIPARHQGLHSGCFGRYWQRTRRHAGRPVPGLVESLGPGVLGMSYQLADVIAFGILVLVLIFRPTGIVGEVLTEEKV